MNIKHLPLLAIVATLIACGDSGTSTGDDNSTSSQAQSSAVELSSGQQPSSGTNPSSDARSSGTSGTSATSGTSNTTISSSQQGTSNGGGNSSIGGTSNTGTSSSNGSTTPSSTGGNSSQATGSSTGGTSSAIGTSSSAGVLPPGSTFKDPRDGQVYNIVQIGTQVWFAENLNFGTWVTGTASPKMKDDTKVEKFCYNDIEANCDTYGGLYQWHELMGLSGECRFMADTCLTKLTPKMQGICPAGWHVPDTTEFWVLIRKAQAEHPGQENAVLRDETFGGAQYPGLDAYGFAVIGAGLSGFCGPSCTSFSGGLNQSGYLWTSTLDINNKAHELVFYGDRDNFSYILSTRATVDYGQSVRCIRN